MRLIRARLARRFSMRWMVRVLKRKFSCNALVTVAILGERRQVAPESLCGAETDKGAKGAPQSGCLVSRKGKVPGNQKSPPRRGFGV